nr:restriction endonuclease subunit S [Amylibacter sp.]
MSESVPEGWELEPLSALADYHNGRAFKPEDWSTNGLPILRIAQINDPFRETDCYQGSDILDKHLIRKGDLVFSWSATLKAILWGHYDAVLNQHIFKVVEKPNVSRSFLQQLLEYSIEKLAASSHGSTMKHIKKGVLDEFHCPIPPSAEQKKIASILTSVDDVIEATQRQIDKLQDLKKATMNELLTKGIGHTEFKDSELGRIPKSWEVLPLSAFVLNHKGGAALKPTDFASEGFPVIPKKALQFGGTVNLGEKRTYCSLDFAKRNKTHVVNSDYTIATLRDLVPSGPSIGLLGVLEEPAEFILAQGVYGFRLNDKLDNWYLAYVSNTDWYRKIMRNMMVGSTQVHIRTSEFLEIKIPVPPLSEQKKFSKIIGAIEALIRSKNGLVEQMKSLKKSLTQDLLTGKMRVKVN